MIAVPLPRRPVGLVPVELDGKRAAIEEDDEVGSVLAAVPSTSTCAVRFA